jgi:hypothetical protein
MIKIALHLWHWIRDRRCPFCNSVKVRRSQRKSAFEVALLPSLHERPFRCQSCGNRFYSILNDKKKVPGSRQHLPVLVYGRKRDEDPFQEETYILLLNSRAGLITLATNVEPGQQLILLNPTSEEDQRCRVVFVDEQRRGRSTVGIQFSPPVSPSAR